MTYPIHPGHKENTTSRDAAVAMRPRAKALRQIVLTHIGRHPGLTADEIAQALGYSLLTIRPRVSELHLTGEIEHTGERRRNQSGMTAHCWRVKPKQIDMDLAEFKQATRGLFKNG